MIRFARGENCLLLPPDAQPAAGPPPAIVFFHAMDEEIQLRCVDEDGQAILKAIGDASPMEWSDLKARLPQLDRRTLAAHCRTLLEHGLVARL